MAASGGPSSELVQQVQALIEDADTTVVLAMKLSKNQASWTVAGRRGRLQSKPRIIAITAKRNPDTQKFKVKIHIIKPGGGAQPPELLKSYRLQALTSIELVTSDTTGRSFLLVFDEKKDSSQPQWTTRTLDDRNYLIVCLLRMSQENLKTLPKVVGIDVVEMALWARTHSRPLPMVGLPGSADEETLALEGEQGAVERSMMAQDSLVSKVEEEDMEALLGTYVIGIDEAEAFSERLKKELAALEAANVHAILESEALVEEVLDGLDEAAERVEDMENWLNVFNVKLRHMRDDIESIEAQNNMLQVQAKNNKRLLAELDALLESLYVPPQFASVLLQGSLEEAYLPEVLDACDWLLNAMARLDPPVMNPHYAHMRAVREKKSELEKLRTTFGRRATDYVGHFLASAVETQIAQLQKYPLKGQPDHKELRRRCQPYSRLVMYLKKLNPDSTRVLRKAYCQAFNLLIRREARDLATELKNSARVAGKGGGSAPFADQPGTTGAPERVAGGQVLSNAETQGVSDAYYKMLRAFLPLITDEATFMRSFLCFGDPDAKDAQGAPAADAAAEAAQFSAATEELFSGIQEDFFGIVDWGFRVDPLRCISMAGLTEGWQQQQQKQPPGTPGENIVRKLLLELQTRIRQLFFKYVEEANSQIEKYDRGMKQTGILSFIPRFASLAIRMEGLVSNNCRDIVDQCYKKLVGSMFTTLEKIAALDPRQKEVLLLENHAAFQNSTYDLAGSIPVLRMFYSQSSETYEAACSRYIDSVIMGQFDKLFEYKQKIKNLLNTIETEEIPFQIGFGKADLRKVLKSQLTGVDKSLQAMALKMKKNLTSGELLPSLWSKCEETFMQQYADMEALIAKCYSNEAISPSSREMKELFRQVAL